MLQFVYRDKLFIIGKSGEILSALKELQNHFKTLKEFLDFKSAGFNRDL